MEARMKANLTAYAMATKGLSLSERDCLNSYIIGGLSTQLSPEEWSYAISKAKEYANAEARTGDTITNLESAVERVTK